MAIDINIPIEDAVTDGSLNPVTSNAVFDALADKANTADLGATAFSNDYNDLDNLPTIPAAQVNADWNATSGVAEILNKPTIPSTSGFVPYTGATADVDLGVHDLTATQGTFATSGNPDTLTVNHSSGSGKALTITKGGSGEGIYVNKTSGSGNAVTVVGDLEATNLKRTGGTSAQFLKANGSIDSTSYQPTLVSGTNIKTVNGTSLLGSGDITVGGGGITVGTTAVTSGTDTRIFFQNGGVVQQSSKLTFNGTLFTVSDSSRFVGSNSTGFTSIFSIFRGATEVFKIDEYASRFSGSLYVNSITGANTDAILFGNQSGSGKLVTMSPTQGRLAIGYSSATYNAALDVKSQGALSTDIAFRVRNSADTANLGQINGDGTFRFGDANGGLNSSVSLLTDGRLFLSKSGSNFIELNPSAANRLYSTNGWDFEAVGTGKYLTFAANGAVRMRMIDGTIQIGSFSTSDNATNTMYFLNGTAPNTNHTDIFKIYSADIVAGNAAPHFRTENGSVIKLYKQDLPTNPTNAEIATFLSNLGLANLI